MTARFKSPFIHDFMMKHNPNYKIDSEWGVHKHVAALEKVVKHRRKEEERLQEERQREMDRLAAMNSVREEEQSYTPLHYTPPQPNEEKPIERISKRIFLQGRGYDTSNMSESEIKTKNDEEHEKIDAENRKYLQSKGYTTLLMSPLDVTLKTFEEEQKDKKNKK